MDKEKLKELKRMIKRGQSYEKFFDLQSFYFKLLFRISRYILRITKVKFECSTYLIENLNKLNLGKFDKYSENRFLRNNEYKTIKLPENVKRDIEKNIKYCNQFKNNKREINIFGEDNIIKEIDSILNMFDSILGYKFEYKIDIYLSNIYKYTTYNSGSVIRKPGYVLVFRREEWRKVLIHELIHKTKLHLLALNKYLKVKNIPDTVKVNESYVEYFAIILFGYWTYKYKNIQGSLKEYLDIRLSLECGWSLFQVKKIIERSKLGSLKEYLNSDKKEDRFLHYYVIKTYFLLNSKYQQTLNFNNKKDRSKWFNSFKNINILDKSIVKPLNIVFDKIKRAKNQKMNEMLNKTLRMSFRD